MSLDSLQTQAVLLYGDIERRTRRLASDRLRLGKLLLRIRAQYAKQQGGMRRGIRGGEFCKWLKSAGFNASMAYQYIHLAEKGEWQSGKQASRRRIVYWQNFAKKMKAAKDNRAKVKLLQHAVVYLVGTYEIDAKVTVR